MNNNFFLSDRLTDEQIKKFKLFDNEKLIVGCREHLLLLALRLAGHTLLGLFLTGAFFFVFITFLHSWILAASVAFLLVLIFSTALVRELIHWSFHMYIATNRQLIEVRYMPLLSEAVNSVLTDQIRCTEIDVEMFGIIPELFGIGDVVVTFDRPTHKEMLVLKGVRSPRLIANLLSAQMHQTNPNIQPTFRQSVPRQTPQLLWGRELKRNRYRFLGDVDNKYNTN